VSRSDRSGGWAVTGLAAILLASPPTGAQSPVRSCSDTPKPSWCTAAAGVRPGGWAAQHRSEVMARQGVVTTSQPLAAQAGLDVLKRGGNAIDAAVVTAAVLNVVEPMMTGLAGDLFAVIYVAKENRVYALDASGKAPSGATVARMNGLGYAYTPDNWGPGSGMPEGGILPVTVPGSIWGWEEVLRRFGTLSLREALQPAVEYAESGFPVSEVVASSWELPKALPPDPANARGCCTQLDPDSVATWYVDGKPPRAGDVFRNADLAKTLRQLQRQGSRAFYTGEIARALVAKSSLLGGTMTLEDLASYSGRWVEPARSTYRGHDIYMLPPPAQTWAANLMLNVLEACVPNWAPGKTLASLGPRDPLYWHMLVEAKKLAYADLFTHNADPEFKQPPLERLLSPGYARSLCSRASMDRAAVTAAPVRSATPPGDTIVLSTADRFGNMVAWVNSNYGAFGSGLTVPGHGFVLHNRGALFTLDPAHPNAIAPHKRPFNTLSAGFVMKDNRPLMTITLMGGIMQAQGIAQMLVNVIDLGANVQASTDMARFFHGQISNTLGLESPLFDIVGAQLLDKGHRVRSVPGDWVGGYQAIMVTPDASSPAGSPAGRTYRAGSDHRKDGQAVGY
jgi:gamma-glutamyltranspeptidase / glutathione hydrolase